MSNYAQSDGHSKLFSYHAPADVYAYVVEEAERRGVSRNKAVTEIVKEHRAAAAARADRAAKRSR